MHRNRVQDILRELHRKVLEIYSDITTAAKERLDSAVKNSVAPHVVRAEFELATVDSSTLRSVFIENAKYCRSAAETADVSQADSPLRDR